MSLKACVLVLVIAATAGTEVSADEPLPLPRKAPVEIFPAPPQPLIVYRVSQYEVWQHLSPDRSGRFRPRVILTPQGAFYSYSGLPYPWVTALPQNFMPYAAD